MGENYLENCLYFLIIVVIFKCVQADDKPKNPLIPLRGIVNLCNKIADIEKKAKILDKKDPNSIVFKSQEILPLRNGFMSLIDRLEEYEVTNEKNFEEFLVGIVRDKKSLNASAKEFITKYESKIHQLLSEYNVFADKLEKHGDSRKRFQQDLDDLITLEIIEKPKRSMQNQEIEEPYYSEELGKESVNILKSLYSKHKQIEKYEKTLAKYKDVPEDELERDWIDDVQLPAKNNMQELDIEITEIIENGRETLKFFIPHIAEAFKKIDQDGLEIMEKYKHLNSRWAELNHELIGLEIDIEERIENFKEILQVRSSKKNKKVKPKVVQDQDQDENIMKKTADKSNAKEKENKDEL